MTPEPAFGTEDWLAWRFDQVAREDIFGDYRPTPNEPVLVLLGGQPAAGKTQAQEAVLAERPDEHLVPLTGDDLREYHPDYKRLVGEDALSMPGETAPVSGGLVRLALDHAFTHRYSMLLEGTFRDTDMVTGTAIRFANAGYRIEVAAVATAAPVSRLSIEQRAIAAKHPRIGRWSSPDSHQTALTVSPAVVAALENLPSVARIQVFSREKLLLDSSHTPDSGSPHTGNAAEVLRAEQTRAVSPDEAVAWLASYEKVFTRARERPGYLCQATAPAYRLLQADADAMIRLAASAPDVDIDVFEREQTARGAHLDRAVPEVRSDVFKWAPQRRSPSTQQAKSPHLTPPGRGHDDPPDLSR